MEQTRETGRRYPLSPRTARKRRLAVLSAALCGIMLSCSSPVLKPEAAAGILASRGIVESDGAATSADGEAVDDAGSEAKKPGKSSAAVVLRIAVKGSLAVERFGVTVKLQSSARDYWRTEILEEHIPPGGSATIEIKVDFDSGDEVYKEGSAVIDASWFE